MVDFPSELDAGRLRRSCSADELLFTTTAEVKPLEGIIGQERATRAIEFGIEMSAEGYNIFAMGPSGAGKTSTILRYLAARAEEREAPQDWAYVRNVSDPYHPRALPFPAGQGRLASVALRDSLRQTEVALREAFTGSVYEEAHAQIIEALQTSQQQILMRLDSFAQEHSFGLQQTPTGLTFLPLQEGKPLSPEDLAGLTPEQRQKYAEQEPILDKALDEAIRQLQQLREAADTQISELNKRVAHSAIDPLLQALQQRFSSSTAFVTYVQEVAEDLIERVVTQQLTFLQKESGAKQEGSPMVLHQRERSWIHDYELNLIVDHTETKGAPVIHEINPTYSNLTGKVEYRAEFGTLVPDHHTIRPGALHRANGGYLVINADTLLAAPMAWEALTRSLRYKEIRIEEPAVVSGAIPAASLAPDPIPLDVKVVMIGSPSSYYALWAYDGAFAKLFKVRADFAGDMDWSQENMMKVAQFVRTRTEEAGLLPFSLDAVTEVIEFGGRLVESQERLTTRFAVVADILVEADFWAHKKGAELVEREHIRQAIQERRYRSNLYEERLQRMIHEGTVMVDTEGAVVGQINGLAIITMGDYAFGKPSRITASTYLGSKGVINIERESKLSGRIHDKGVLILVGYLGNCFGQDKPLNLNASIAFEQSYEGVDGDSASSTELYALLSAIAEIPIKQAIAATGSVNQRGEIQAVGGVTAKIEGFFDVCQKRGLSGEQGVIIPAANVRHLMLRHDVIDAVAQGKFHIWPVRTVDEGFSILTGLPAGMRDETGQFPEGTWNRLVDDNLREMAVAYAHFARKSRENNNNKDNSSEKQPEENEGGSPDD
ncbi:MAG: AAA family ATPase [Chloroflexi bacterium]|nr:AAA family ATPase [Chloroflexota bacterium]